MYKQLFRTGTVAFTNPSVVPCYNEAKDNISSEFIHNPLEGQILKKIPSKFRQVKNKRLKTVRGRISLEDKKFYRSCYSNTFENEMMKAIKKDKKGALPNLIVEDSESDMEKWKSNEQKQQEREDIKIEQKFKRNPELKEYVERQVRQAKEDAIKQFQFCNEKN